MRSTSWRLVAVVCVGCLLAPLVARSQPRIAEQAGSEITVALEVGRTRLLRLTDRIIRISVADPNVADVQVVTPLQVLLTAKAVGFTPIILWGENDKPLVVSVEARRNLGELDHQLKELFPEEDIKVSAAGDLVVLSGTVTDVRVPARLAAVANLHTERLANLVEVSGEQQVQLEVRFAEVSRTGMRKMGVNLLWRDAARGYTGSMTGPGSAPGAYLDVPGTAAASGPPVVPVASFGDGFNLLFSAGLSEFPFSAVLSVLAQNGLAHMLAEPVLVALSGQEASFHAGGEVPIVLSAFMGANVKFKKFGVLLKFVPTVLGEGTINLKVASEVSEPDPASGATLAGFSIPGFKTRNSDTTVRLKDGQSFAIAGLLSDSSRSLVKKIPILGDIPILGALFRSTSFQREESELLVVIRASLVKPLQPGDTPALPGEDEVFDPDDFQLFLMGRVESVQRDRSEDEGHRSSGHGAPRQAGGPEGPVGFVRP